MLGRLGVDIRVLALQQTYFRKGSEYTYLVSLIYQEEIHTLYLLLNDRASFSIHHVAIQKRMKAFI
jgi:hypothetical protein